MPLIRDVRVIALSPGIAYGCFNLLRMADKHPMPFAQLRAELPRHGGMEVGRLLEVVQELRWLRSNDSGIAVLTPAGARLLGIDLDYLRLRQALLDYVEAIRPPWIKNAIDGRVKVLSFSPTEIAQSLIEAELARGYGDGFSRRATGVPWNLTFADAQTRPAQDRGTRSRSVSSSSCAYRARPSSAA